MEKKPLQVVAAVIRSGDEVLACRRRAHKAAGGRWEFPVGKVEPHESLVAALRREIREELSVDIDVGRLIVRATTTVRDQEIDLRCFEAILLGPAPTQSTDHDELRWVHVSQLDSLDWADPDYPMVSRLVSELDFRP